MGAARTLFPLAGFLALVALLDYADWGEGPTRAAGLALGAAALAWSWRHAPPWSAAYRPWLLLALAVALLRFGPALSARGRPAQLNDIGWTTVRAVEAIRAGRSPYAGRLDPQRDLPRDGPGFAWFMGYKYGPLVPRFYAPFLRWGGVPRGLFAGNALLLAVAVVVVAALAARAGGLDAALAAATGLLWPQMVRFELLERGVNDLLPTALAALALLLACARPGRPAARAALAGVALGLSLSAKPLPGALLLLLLPGTVPAGALAAGLAVGLAPLVPDLLATPRELVANLVLFNLVRPGDSTGAGAALPPWLSWSPQLVGLALAVVVAVRYHRGPRTPRALVVSAALLLTVFLAGGKIIHRNYLLWWLPLAAAGLGAACYARAGPDPPPARAGAPSPGRPG